MRCGHTRKNPEPAIDMIAVIAMIAVVVIVEWCGRGEGNIQGASEEADGEE